jgi:hypothetical protein
MATIVTRAGKGSPLTNTEVDTNFTNINDELGQKLVASDATSANTASKIVQRDASGNFSAGTVTAALSGNATTATTLQTARTINGVSFNGSANITLPTVNTSGDQTVAGAKTFTSDAVFTASIRWDVSTSDPAHQRADARDDATSFSRLHWYGVSAAGATSNFRHAWYDGAAYINVTAASNTVTFSGALTATQFNGPLSGNATTATTLQTARTIGGVSFNGSANINLPGVNTAGNQNTTGSAATLTTARTINGTSFNGSANITTANWGTARTLTIGNTGKSVNGAGNVSWTLAEIGGVTSVNGQTGDVSVLTTTSNVLNATAGASAGAVGTYGLMNSNSGTDIAPNEARAGSGLRFTTCGNASFTSLIPSGTWRCMGFKSGTNTSFSGVFESTLWLRIS